MSKKTTSISPGELFSPIRRHLCLTFFSFLSVLITIIILTVLSDPFYEATAVLSIREGGELNGQLFGLPSILYQKYFIRNQVAILESRTIASQVVDELIASEYKDSLSLLGYKPSNPTRKLKEQILGFINKNMASNTPISKMTATDRFRIRSRVINERDTDIIKLKGMASSAWEAAFIVNTWLRIYQDYTHSDTRNEVKQIRKFLELKLKEMEVNLAQSEERLRDYEKKKKVVALPKETEQLVTRLSEIESSYHQTLTELESIQNQLRYLKIELSETKQNLIDNMSNLTNSELEQLQKSRAELVIRMAAFESQLIGAGLDTETNEKLAEMQNRLNGITQLIIKETKRLVSDDLIRLNPLDQSESLMTQILSLETQEISLQAKIESQKEIIEDYQDQLEMLPEKSLQLANLQRNVQLNSKLYIMLKEKFEETRIREAGQVSIVRVVDMAHAPGKPVRPNKPLNILLGFIFGSLLGIALSFGREYFEDKIQNAEDFEEMGLKVIGRIPLIKKEKTKLSRRATFSDILRAKNIYPFIITRNSGYSTLAESYRVIGTSIYLANRKQSRRTILITSAEAGDGKSMNAANLAITMAQKGIKTLLIDSDLRRPVLDVLFTGSHRKTGLANYLSSVTPWKECIRETSINKLDLMPAGQITSNAAEMLSTRVMKQFLKEARDAYDILLLDSPPLLPVTDATILSAFVDSVILVARAGKTERKSIRYALDLLSSVGVHIMGSIITGVKASEMSGYKTYYESYYGELDDRRVRKISK